MANQQHIDWLLEGTESWNARRKSEEFTPDFESADIRGAFEVAGLLNESGGFDINLLVGTWIDLRNANFDRAKLSGVRLEMTNIGDASFRNADLRKANFSEASLVGANFEGADLRGAFFNNDDLDMRMAKFERTNLEGVDFNGVILAYSSFSKANFGGADLRRAYLTGVNFSGANLAKATLEASDVRTRQVPATDTNDGARTVRADLSTTIGLTQGQLDGMQGDSGTILPDHLTRPAHWPEIDLPGQSIEPPDQAPVEIPSRDASPSLLRDQIAIILSAPVRTSDAAEHFIDQLDYAIRTFRAANPSNDPPDDLILAESFNDKIREIRQSLATESSEQTTRLERELSDLRRIISELEETIRDHVARIEELEAGSAERTDMQKMKSAFAISFGTALGAGTAATIFSAADTLLGQYGSTGIQQLRDAFGSLFVAPTPASPPTLPPTTSL